MHPCELAAYALGAALVTAGASLAVYELGRRRGRRGPPTGPRPGVEAEPAPRAADPETTVAVARASIADMVAAEGRAILADAEALRKSGRFKTPPPDPKDP